jgi:hypothetical protein
VQAEVTPRRRRLRRIWRRAGIACVVLLAAALTLPRVRRALDPQRERAHLERAPVYVMPNGERRRAIAVTRGDPATIDDARGDRALWWWCGILAAVVVAGAVAQSVSVKLGDDEDES